MSIPRHKVFISYYHTDDQYYKNQLINMKMYDNSNKIISIFDDYSVHEHEINDEGLSSEQIRRIIRDDYMQNATVLVLLCGQNTKRRKYIDWEIHTAMYHSDVNPQMGIVVVNLPTIRQLQRSACEEDKPYFGQGINWITSNRDRTSIEQDFPYLPSRIVDNFTRSQIYIPVVNWNTIANNPVNLAGIIDVAFNNRYKNDYDHSAPLRRNNS